MSTIKVDTIQKNGGASEISIDKLGGVTAAGSMIVVGERSEERRVGKECRSRWWR